MDKLSVLKLLKEYETLVKKGDIQFLKPKTEQQGSVLELIAELIVDFTEATEKGDLSVHLDWHVAHTKGRELWKQLASCALNSIDPGSKGNSRLFEFLEKATEFEELLYGLEEYYRDHTLHSLWVYFIGEHLLRGKLGNIYDNLDWHIFNDIEKDKEDYAQKLLNDAKSTEVRLRKSINGSKDAIWCLMALCHDLGYSLSKLDRLNEKVKGVLSFYDLPNFNHLGYSLNIENQYAVEQFLELVSMDVRLMPHGNKKEVLLKAYRDDSTYWWLCRALEKKQHGILSSLLLYKILGLFAHSWVRGPSEEWGLDEREVKDNVIRGEILFAIAQHEYDFAHLCYMSSLADVLAISDELEEFSRYGRQMLSRKYYDTMAETQIEFKPKRPKQTDEVEITMRYDVKRADDLKGFFHRKAERLSKFYSLGQHDSDIICRIKNITMEASHGDLKFSFTLGRDTQHSGQLPSRKLNGETHKAGKYTIEFLDDKLLVVADKDKILLEQWLDV